MKVVVKSWFVVAVVLLGGCGRVASSQHGGTSASGGASGVAGSTGAGSGFGGDRPLNCDATTPPEVPARLLQAYELKNELLVFEEPLDDAVQPQAQSRIFALDEQYPVSPGFVQGQAELASRIARHVSTDAAKLEKLTGCDLVKDGEEACRKLVKAFVQTRLFRGLASQETDAELDQLLDTGQQLGGGFAGGVRAVLEVALQSPEFLYRVELGRPAADRDARWSEPTDLEMASRLSFLFWGSGPDDTVLTAARQGKLADPQGLAAEAQRMLQDPRARPNIGRFYRELLGAGGQYNFDPANRPSFTPAIAGLMQREFDAFVQSATFQGAGDFPALFAPVTWVNGPLAQYYGYPGVSGDDFQRVSLDSARYGGLLTQGAWLANGVTNSTNPSVRGLTVSRGLLCREVPPEPAALPIDLPEPIHEPATTRQRFEYHAHNPVCFGCHQMMDPIGFGLEHFDARGRYRDIDNGLAIDASGFMELTEGRADFNGAGELASAIAKSAGARDCFVTQWQRFAYGRPEADSNTCAHQQLAQLFIASQGNVLQLLVGLTQTESFRYRKLEEGQP